ncbi:MAG TPA: alanine racemase [Fimbriimonas sp.]
MNLSEVQIDRQALLHNLEALKDLVPRGMKVAAVVKGNAYGHGMREVVPVLDGQVDFFQVDDIEELRELRQVTDTPALVLGHVPAPHIAEAVSLGAELALFDSWQLPSMDEAKASVHLEIDALLGRLGVLPDDIDAFVEELGRYPHVRLVAAYGHFSNIEDTTDQTHAWAQIEAFEAAFGRLAEKLPGIGRHMSATSGLMTIEPIRRGYGYVRLGIGLYGMYPSGPLARTHSYLQLQPVMRWATRLAQVKTIPARHPVGYGLTYFAPHQMSIGIVPQGYSDGYDRGLSNTGEVLVRGIRCPVLGRVAMNMLAIDLSAVEGAAVDDEVVLLGDQAGNRITAEEIAVRIGTINYEVTTRVSALLPRVVL